MICIHISFLSILYRNRGCERGSSNKPKMALHLYGTKIDACTLNIFLRRGFLSSSRITRGAQACLCGAWRWQWRWLWRERRQQPMSSLRQHSWSWKVVYMTCFNSSSCLICSYKRSLKQWTESLSERQDNRRPLCQSNHHLHHHV